MMTMMMMMVGDHDNDVDDSRWMVTVGDHDNRVVFV